jgi:hypothetical protein
MLKFMTLGIVMIAVLVLVRVTVRAWEPRDPHRRGRLAAEVVRHWMEAGGDLKRVSLPATTRVRDLCVAYACDDGELCFVPFTVRDAHGVPVSHNWVVVDATGQIRKAPSICGPYLSPPVPTGCYD